MRTRNDAWIPQLAAWISTDSVNNSAFVWITGVAADAWAG
jgi:hypothetical protein